MARWLSGDGSEFKLSACLPEEHAKEAVGKLKPGLKSFLTEADLTVRRLEITLPPHDSVVNRDNLFFAVRFFCK